MSEYAPLIASIFSGLIIPGIIWAAFRVRTAIRGLEEQMVKNAEEVAMAASASAVAVAEAARQAAAETEERQGVLLNQILEQAQLTNGRINTLENGKLDTAREFGVLRERLGFVEGNLAGMNLTKGKEPS